MKKYPESFRGAKHWCLMLFFVCSVCLCYFLRFFQLTLILTSHEVEGSSLAHNDSAWNYAESAQFFQEVYKFSRSFLDAPQPTSRGKWVGELDFCTMYKNTDTSTQAKSLCKPFVLDNMQLWFIFNCVYFLGVFCHLIDCIVTTAYRKSHCTIAKILPSRVKLFRRCFYNINSKCNKNI